MMKEFRMRPVRSIAAGVILLQGCSGAADTASDDWIVLFNGHNLDGWHTYNEAAPRAAWIVEDGAIVLDVDEATNDETGGDLISDAEFENFELELEWKISPGGNSGIFFGVRELPELVHGYDTGLEMQVLDNALHNDGKTPITSAGACYGLYAPAADATRPVGEYNQVRIIRRDNHVEYWLNGQRVVSYEIGSDDWATRIAGSKFADWEHFAKYPLGRIGLQDHTDRVWYRNIRIRRLDGG
jgi:hypothetical protein